jgi:hypothetical protein
MSRYPRTAALAGAALLTCAAPAAAAPQLTVHPIFSGGQKTFHVGAVAMVQARRPAPKIEQICVEPAPIERPACSRSRFVAPAQTGTTKIDVTFVDGTTASISIDVLPAATRIGGRTAVPGHAACDTVTLYSNYDPRTRKFHDRRTSVKRDTNLALYNRIGKDALVMWDYKTGKAGFGKVSCAKRGLATT